MTRTEQNIHNFVGMDFFILHFCYSLFLYVEWRKKHNGKSRVQSGFEYFARDEKTFRDIWKKRWSCSSVWIACRIVCSLKLRIRIETDPHTCSVCQEGPRLLQEQLCLLSYIQSCTSPLQSGEKATQEEIQTMEVLLVTV